LGRDVLIWAKMEAEFRNDLIVEFLIVYGQKFTKRVLQKINFPQSPAVTHLNQMIMADEPFKAVEVLPRSLRIGCTWIDKSLHCSAGYVYGISE
jgi:hypothetical protein